MAVVPAPPPGCAAFNRPAWPCGVPSAHPPAATDRQEPACSSAPPLPTARVGRGQRPRRSARLPAPPVPGGCSPAAGLEAAPSEPDGTRRVLTARLATARAAEAPGQPGATVRAARPSLQRPGRGGACGRQRLSPAPPRPMRGRGRPLKVNGRGPGACALGAAEELGWVGRASGARVAARSWRAGGWAGAGAGGWGERPGTPAASGGGSARLLITGDHARARWPGPRGAFHCYLTGSWLPPAGEVTAWRARPPPAPPRPRSPGPPPAAPTNSGAVGGTGACSPPCPRRRSPAAHRRQLEGPGSAVVVFPPAPRSRLPGPECTSKSHSLLS